MSKYRRRKFEVLENRLCLTVTATVADGDLVVEGDIADTAVIGGETELGLGEQREGWGTCRNRAWKLDTLVFNGRPLGFFLRGLMR